MAYHWRMGTFDTRSLIKKAGGPGLVATWFGISSQAVSQWEKTPAEYCPKIERETAGAVRCEDLRPDVDWAYLRGTAKPTKKAA